MVKPILVFVIILLSSGFVAQSQEINQMDAQGLRHGLWQKNYKGSKQLRYTGTFNHGKEVGDFKFYDKSGGHPTAIKTYTEGTDLLDIIFYTKSGKKISEGKMKDRLKEGEWLYYHKDGKAMMAKEVYRLDKLEGKRFVYFENGKKAQETNYNNGLREGQEIHYNENGIVLKEFVYQNDKLEGPVKLYNYDGSLLREGQYKANRKHGYWKYYANGELEKTVKFPQNKIGVQH